MGLLGDLTVKVTSDISGLTSGMNSAKDTVNSSMSAMSDSASKSSGSMIGSFLNFTSSVGFAVTNIKSLANDVVSLGESLLTPAANVEQMTTAFTTLLGSTKAANDEMQKLDTFASKTPFETLDIDRAASQLIGFGTSANDVIPDLTAIGDALSAVGRGSSANLNQVVDIFGKIQTEGGLTVGTMQQLSRDGINAWSIMEQQTGKTKDQLTAMIDQGLIPANDAIHDLTTGIEKNPLYAGGMAKQSGTMIGLISTLKSNWDQMLASFGSPILKALEPEMAGLGNVLASPAFKQFAGQVGQDIVNAFIGIGKFVQTAIKDFSGFGNVLSDLPIGVFISNIQYLGQQIGFLLNTAMGVARMIAGEFTGSFDGANSKIKDFASNALGFLSGIVAKVAYGIQDFANYLHRLDFGEAIADVQSFTSTLSSQFGPVIHNLISLLSGQFKQVLGDVGQDVQQIGGWFQKSVIPALRQALPPFLDLAKTLLGTLLPAIIIIRGVFIDVLQHAFQVFAPIVEKIIPPAIQLAGVLAGALSSAIKFIAPYILEAAKAIGEFADGLMDRIAPIISAWVDTIIKDIQALSAFWGYIWPFLSGLLKGVWLEIAGIVKIAWALVSGIINIGLDILSGNWKRAWQDVQIMVAGVWDGIQTYISGAVDVIISILAVVWSGVQAWIVTPIQNAWNSIVGIWDGAASAFSGWFSGIYDAVSSWVGSIGGMISAPFTEAWNTVSGIFGSIGQGISDLENFNITGALHDFGVPGFAEGTDYSPGTWAYVGERGKELMYVPRGAQIIPNNRLPAQSRALSAVAAAAPGLAAANQEIHVYVGLDTGSVSEGVLKYQQQKARQLKVVRK